MRIFMLGGVVAGALFAATPVIAEEWYVGIGAGVAQIDELCNGEPARLCDDDGGAARLAVGWKFNPYLGMEIAVDSTGDFTSPGARGAGFDGDTFASYLGVNLLGSVPLGSRVTLFGGVSGAFSYVRTDVYDDDYDSDDCEWAYDYYDDDWEYYCRNRNRYDDYESESSIVGGALVGVEVKVARRVRIRVQGQRFFNVDGGIAFGGRSDIDAVTANVVVAVGPLGQ